jgi:hypothetical protein
MATSPDAPAQAVQRADRGGGSLVTQLGCGRTMAKGERAARLPSIVAEAR